MRDTHAKAPSRKEKPQSKIRIGNVSRFATSIAQNITTKFAVCSTGLLNWMQNAPYFRLLLAYELY
jgi:hypothetical protein